MRLVCTAGRDLLEALQDEAERGDVEAGWVRATGALRDVVLAVETEHGLQVVFDHPGPVTLTSFDAVLAGGEISTASAVVSTWSHGQPLVATGRVVRAVVHDIAAFLWPGGEAPVQRAARPAPVVQNRGGTPMQATPSASAATPMRAAAPATPSRTSEGAAPPATAVAVERPVPAGTSAWTQLAQMSDEMKRRLEEADNEMDPDELRREDALVHPSLGTLIYVRAEGSDKALVRLPNGRTQPLKIGMFRILREGAERRFRLAIR